MNQQEFQLKAIAGSLAHIALLASCAAPPQDAAPQAAAGQAAAVGTVDTAPANDDADYETIFVPPPVGSLLGGGTVRVPGRSVSGNDQNALLGNVRRLNAAAGSKDERRFVVAAVARVTGVSARELQSQQDVLPLRFGELCVINAIARGNSSKVDEIAQARSKGQSWANLARPNGLSVSTATHYSNTMERAKGGRAKMKATGVKIQPNARPNG